MVGREIIVYHGGVAEIVRGVSLLKDAGEVCRTRGYITCRNTRVRSTSGRCRAREERKYSENLSGNNLYANSADGYHS